MSMNDLVSDFITRIRNGQQAGLKEISAQHSKMNEAICAVLQEEGYLQGFEVEDIGSNRKKIKVSLKYFEGTPVIKKIDRVSKPGRRVYYAATDLPRYHNGLGIAVISTSKGVLTDFSARQLGVGGEIICNVF